MLLLLFLRTLLLPLLAALRWEAVQKAVGRRSRWLARLLCNWKRTMIDEVMRPRWMSWWSFLLQGSGGLNFLSSDAGRKLRTS